jgi:nucleoside-diphosphate-sugar epimerase
LRQLHPDVTVVEADLAGERDWQRPIAGVDVIVICHAQIGGLDRAAYARNNIEATERLLAAVARPDVYLVHVSSSVVKSMAKDDYVWSKEAQEKLVLASGFSAIVLRPTLMFGWFDRKHLGWLARFMQRMPLFPIPGDGRYLRQPLFAGDFCDIVMSCVERRPTGDYNITGLEPIDYVDLIRAVREACGASSRIVPVPYPLFWSMLFVYGLFSRDPPFTTKQLQALVTPDVFEVIDWPGLFAVKPTALKAALAETYRHPVYSRIVLEF